MKLKFLLLTLLLAGCAKHQPAPATPGQLAYRLTRQDGEVLIVTKPDDIDAIKSAWCKSRLCAIDAVRMVKLPAPKSH